MMFDDPNERVWVAVPAFAANIDFLFSGRVAAEGVTSAAAAGFRGVEVGYLTGGQLPAVRDAARSHAVDIVLTSLNPGDLMSGGPGYMGVPGQRRAVEREMRSGLRVAKSLRCFRISVPPSRVPNGIERTACLEALADHLAIAADIAAPEGVDVLIEPLNSIDWPGFLIDCTADALNVIEATERNNVGLQLDLYHAAMQGEQALASIRRSLPHLRHVQFADVPGRHEPGTGELPLNAAFELLDGLGYAGWVGAEYIPSQSVELTLSWLSDFNAV
jgi:hydroxypyruvate isomerase